MYIRHDDVDGGDETPLGSLQPRGQFEAYYLHTHGVDAVPEELGRVFDEVLEDLQHEG